MNKSLIIIILCIGLIAGFLYFQNQTKNDELVKSVSIAEVEEKSDILRQAEVKKEVAQKIVKDTEVKAKAAVEKTELQAKTTAKEAEVQAATLKNTMDDLLAKAKAYLNDGAYEDAINIAKNVLAQDPNSSEAKSIIQRAQEGLRKIAEDKFQDVGNEFKGALGNFGKSE